jgi:lysozyme
MATNFKLSDLGRTLITHYEGLHDGDLSEIGLQPKMDCSGYWTEGWGRLMIIDGHKIQGEENRNLAYDNITIHTEEEADAAFIVDIAPVENRINALNLNIIQCQFDSIVSFVYNVGFGRNDQPGGFVNSTLLARIKAQAPPKSIELAFAMWNKSGGIIRDGLIARRQSEATLFNTAELVFHIVRNGKFAA